jgi:hypothetical protein
MWMFWYDYWFNWKSNHCDEKLCLKYSLKAFYLENIEFTHDELELILNWFHLLDYFLIIYYIYYLHIWFLIFSELVSSWWLLNISFLIAFILFCKGQGSEHPAGPNIALEYSFVNVITMTNKFNQILGEGSFRRVCYGKLLNGQEG